MPISSGSQPATAKPRKIPNGLRPRRSASLPSITTTALLPSENWLALPAVTTPPGMAGRICATASRVVSGRMPSSLAMVTSRVPRAPVALSATPIRVVIGTISSLNLPAPCAAPAPRRCAQLAADSVFILSLFGYVVALGDLFGGLQHVPVQGGLVLVQPWIAAHMRIHLVLHARKALHAPGDDHHGALGHDPLRRERDRLQSRAAETVDAQARRGHGKSGAQRNRARNVAARRALTEGGAHDDVLDFGGLDAGALHRVPHRMRTESGAVSHVERTLPTLAKAGARR